MDSENHHLRLSEHEHDSCQNSIRANRKDIYARDALNLDSLNRLEKINADVDKYSKRNDWARKIFNVFQDAIRQGAEGAHNLDEFFRTDNSRAKDLEAKQKLIQNQILAQMSILEANSERNKYFENMLERTAELYKKAHNERKKLITTWKYSIGQMTERDRDIGVTEASLLAAKSMTRKREVYLQECIQKHEQHCMNGQEMRAQIELLNDLTSNKRVRLNEISATIERKSDKFNMLQGEVIRNSKEFMNQNSLNRQMDCEKLSKEKTLEQWMEVYAALQLRFVTFEDNNLSAQDKLLELDQLMVIEERNLKILTSENARLAEAMLKAQQHLNELISEERILDVSIQKRKRCV